MTQAGGLLQPEEHFKCESSGSSCRLLLNKRGLRSAPPRKQSVGVPSWLGEWMGGGLSVECPDFYSGEARQVNGATDTGN